MTKDFDDDRYIPCILDWDCCFPCELSVFDVFQQIKEAKERELYDNLIDYESVSYEFEYLIKN